MRSTAFFAGAVALLVGGFSATAASAQEVSTQETTTVTYRCEDNKGFIAEYTEDGSSVEATFGSKSFTLPRVESASGERFSNGSVTVNTKSNEAFVEVGSEILFGNCVGRSVYVQQDERVQGLW